MRQVGIEIFETMPELSVFHVVELIDAHFEVLDEDGLFGKEGFGGKLLQLLVLDALQQEIFFHVDEYVVEIVGQVVPEEFLEEKGLDS